jgi:hypothetical protein
MEHFGFRIAYTLHLSNNSKFRVEYNEKSIKKFIKAYQLLRSASIGTILGFLEIEEIVPVFVFYSSVIKPLVSHHARWSQGNHRNLPTAGQLGKTEKRRIARGFYRFQLFYSLFGPDGLSRRLFPGHEQRLGHFLDNFEPWEIEEIMCIYWFAEEKNHIVLKDVAWDFDEDNPRFDAERMNPYLPEAAYHLEIFGVSGLS